MTEVLIPVGKNAAETATLLLAAAEKQGHEPFVVRWQPEDGGFRVPEDVAKEAGLKDVDPDQHQADLQRQAQEDYLNQQANVADAEAGADAPKDDAPKAPAKKTTAKKTAAKKSTATKE